MKRNEDLLTAFVAGFCFGFLIGLLSTVFVVSCW